MHDGKRPRGLIALKPLMISWPENLHSAQRRYIAEELVRFRRSDEQRRYAAPQRSAKIDPNPHQIEAVIFALARIREGGCILADEVGLGKTIEAGLVIAQMLAEGAQRVLLVTPKSLLGQWKQELFQLFDIEAREAVPQPGGFDGEGVLLINREAAGSPKGHAALLGAAPFDLCVVDEAHEVFAGIYKRFGKDGLYDPESDVARTAGRLREVLLATHTPVLLLTATPIQNNLAELWGLVQYVDPLGTLLGDLPTFREVFCGDDDRQLAAGQEDELRARLKQVLQRTLRRQAQAFLEKPFVNRQARLFEYTMSPAERSLYDDVTTYLLEPGIFAFQGNQRQLLLLGFHRRMASSTRALAASLERVAGRLRRLTGGGSEAAEAEDVAALVGDLDESDIDYGAEAEIFSRPLPPSPEKLKDELKRVEDFVARANALANDDGKFKALLKAVDFITMAAKAGQGTAKLVIFTESLVTQEHLREQLIASGKVGDADITVFRGTNESRRAVEALARWQSEVPQNEGTKPSEEIAVRLALVHEFKTRSRVLISTEAGAKGLNLQFCNTVVNYDLPWNPQRIEQRIGRCHRYGQQHDVTVINFLAKDNEAQALTFDIISQKLELFGTVLSASDQVLHKPAGPGGEVLVSALGAEFEGELRRIYERARTLDEVTAELRALRDRVGEERKRFEDTHRRTASIIEERFDEGIQSRFRLRRETLPAALAELDQALAQVVIGYLQSRGTKFSQDQTADGLLLHIGGADPTTAAIGPSKEHVSLHLGHPLVVAAVADARSSDAFMPVTVKLPPKCAKELQAKRGKRGRLRLVRVTYEGFERTQLLLPVLVLGDGEVVELEVSRELLRCEFQPGHSTSTVSPAAVEDAVAEVLFGMQREVDEAEHLRFERAMWQANRFIEDRILVLTRRRNAAQERLEAAQQRWESATGSDARTAADEAKLKAETALEELAGAIEKLDGRDDETFRRHLTHIEGRRYRPPTVETLFDLDVDIV